MARSFEIESWIEDGLHVYRYIARGGRVVERSWPGLFEEWTDAYRTPYTEYAVNNNNCEEIAVYLALIWRLTEGRMLYGIPHYHRDHAMFAAGAPYALVDWEYAVESEDWDRLGEIRGFVPARSSVRLHPPPGPWEEENARRAGFFELWGFEMLRDVLRSVLGDATAELNVYALRRTNARKAVAALQGREPPRIADLLDDSELLIDLLIQVDADDGDVIVIHSRDDLAGKLFPLLREYETAIERYEDEVEQIVDMDDFLLRLGELVNLGEEDELRR